MDFVYKGHLETGALIFYLKLYFMEQDKTVPTREYNLSVDVKNTVWERFNYLVEAVSLEEAIEKLKRLKEEGSLYLDSMSGEEAARLTDGIVGGAHETLYDTSEDMTVEENQGNCTVEIIDDSGSTSATLYDNKHGLYMSEIAMTEAEMNAKEWECVHRMEMDTSNPNKFICSTCGKIMFT